MKLQSNAIRLMVKEDMPRCAEINVFAWRSAYRGIVSDEILFNNMLVSSVTVQLSDYVQKNDHVENYVYDDGIVKAFMSLGACRDEDKPNAFEIWGIYVDPLFEMQGIGFVMVNYLEKRAKEQGYREICLWVPEENTDLRHFYLNIGFSADGSDKYLENLGITVLRYTKTL